MATKLMNENETWPSVEKHLPSPDACHVIQAQAKCRIATQFCPAVYGPEDVDHHFGPRSPSSEALGLREDVFGCLQRQDETKIEDLI